MRRYLITGATGFVGSHLCRAIERLHPEDEILKVGRHDRIEGMMSGVDVLIHLGAQTEVRKAMENPEETFQSNIEGTWRVLEECRKAKTPRVIIASTDKAYGWTPPPYKESDPVRATWPYETSKACADLLAQCYEKSYGMNIAITRFGNFYGPGRLNWTTLIPMTIRSVLENRKPVLRSDGNFRRDFLFIEDGIDAYLRLADSNAVGAFNFGTGDPSKVIDVVGTICKMMGWTVGIEIINDSKSEIVDQYLDTSKAKRELGWEPRYTLEQGLERTIPWYRDYLGRKP